MALLHSEPEAALLEAGALSHRLAARYQQAADQFAEHADSDDPPRSIKDLQPLFSRYSESLTRQAEDLDDSARSMDLLPREPKTELETLKQLADHIQTLLEDEKGAALAKRFVDEEESLLQELEQAAKLKPCPEAVTTSITAARERVSELGGRC